MTMAGLWLNMDTVVEGMVRLIVPRARNRISILETYQVDSEWLNTQIKKLGLIPPPAQKGRGVAAPPVELVAFLRCAGVEEAVLAACPWPTLAEMQARYLRVALAHAPSFAVAAEALGRSAARLKRQAQELDLPALMRQRKGTMRPARAEWAALHPLLCPVPAEAGRNVAFLTRSDNLARSAPGLEATTRWILPERAPSETEPVVRQRNALN